MTTYTPILAHPQVDPAQNNKSVTINDLTGLLEGTLNKTKVSATTGDLVLSEADYTGYAAFKASGRAAAYNITFPNTGGNITTRERIFIVWNADTTWNATVKAASTPGTTVVLTPGSIAICYQNGVDTVALFTSSAGGGLIYDIGFFVPGVMTNSQVILIFKFPRAANFAGNFSGSVCKVGINATATTVLDVQKNGSSIGSISIATSGVATFTTTAGAAQSFAINDYLTIVGAATADTTLANVGVTFLGTR